MCSFKRLYKNRYLIALYDRDDEYCCGVFDNIEELSVFVDVKFLKCVISRAIKNYKVLPSISYGKYNYYFIDIYEKHNDCFADEDKEFLKYYENERPLSASEYATKIGVSQRTFMRDLAKYKKGEKAKYEREIKQFYQHNEFEL